MGLINKVSLGLIIICCVTIFSCTQEQHLGQVDLEAFKSDRGGCKNLREKDIANIEAAKDSLLGKSENDIIAILGRYDVQALDSRQKKIFIYYLEKSNQCEGLPAPEKARTMILRFNAVSLVNEVNFQIGLP